MKEQTKEALITKEQMIVSLQKEIDLRTLQLELQTLNASLASERVREMQAIATMAQIQQPAGNPDLVQHVVTQNDIDTIPEFKAQGFEVGQSVGIPKEVYATLYPEEATAL